MEMTKHQESSARLLTGTLSGAEIEALSGLPFGDLSSDQWDEIRRRAAVREIASLVRVAVRLDYDASMEYDDMGGYFPSYTVRLRIEGEEGGAVELDQDFSWVLQGFDCPDDAEPLARLLGKDRVTLQIGPDGAVESFEVTDEGRAAMDRLYEAAVYLASRDVDTRTPIAPLAAN